MLHNPYIALFAAALAAWIFGAAWYGVLGKPYQRALGLNPDDCKGKKMPIAPLVASFVAELVIALILGGIFPLADLGWLAGAQAGFMTGIGFMATTTLVNNMFQQKTWMLTLIDAGHWVLVAAIEGAVLGALS